jgi:hypothetical protein
LSASEGVNGSTSPAVSSGGVESMPSNTSDCGRPACASLMILMAVGPLSARTYLTAMPGYFLLKVSTSGRTAWFTIRLVYQTTSPSFLAAS